MAQDVDGRKMLEDIDQSRLDDAIRRLAKAIVKCADLKIYADSTSPEIDILEALHLINGMHHPMPDTGWRMFHVKK